MKKNLFVLGGALLAVFTGPASAEPVVPYAAVKIGHAQTDWKHHWSDNGIKYRGSYDDDVSFASLAGGIDFSGPLRGEVELSIFGDQKNAKSRQGYNITEKLEFETLLVNGYWDFKNSTSLTPYVGIGLGVAHIDAKGTITGANAARTSLKGYATAYSAGVGVAWGLNDSFSLDLAYRYTGVNDSKFDLEQQQVLLGVRLGF